MEDELKDRLGKVPMELPDKLPYAQTLIENTIRTIEAVKAYKIGKGYYLPEDIQAFDHVSGVLRNCR